MDLIRRSYLKYPVRFAYLIYDIIYYPEFTEAYLNVVGNDVVGFILIFSGLRCTAIHVVGNVNDPVNYVPTSRCLDVQIEAEPGLISQLANHLMRRGLVEQHRYLTMVCSSNSFREFQVSGGYVVRRVTIGDVKEFIKLKNEQGTPISNTEATLRLLSPHWHYYGAFINGELVSMAGTYLKLPEIWVIGDVYTTPGHRGRGLAKAVTSAVTRDALNSGATAMLHVDEENQPAVLAYRRIGYVATQEFVRIRYKE